MDPSPSRCIRASCPRFRHAAPAVAKRPDTLFVHRTYRLSVEMGIVAATLLVWQILRIPIEGSQVESLAHARDWLGVERALHLDVGPTVVRFLHEHGTLNSLADAIYGNAHVPVAIGLLAAVRLRSPARYPKLRTTFVLAHVPALVVIAVYPLAPPHWLTEMPFSTGPPPDAEDLRNATAAVASLHFGYALLVAGAALRLWPRSPLAWASLLYPPLIFVVILGTGNHYVLDTLVGAGCVALAAVGAHLIHGRLPHAESASASIGRATLVALAFAFVGFLANWLAVGAPVPQFPALSAGR